MTLYRSSGPDHEKLHQILSDPYAPLKTVSSQEAVNQAMALIESEDPLVLRRSYRYLKEQKLDPSQKKKLAEFEQPQEGG